MLTEKLKILLSESKISQAEIARQISVKPQQITNWKNGKSLIPFCRLVEIAKICGYKNVDIVFSV